MEVLRTFALTPRYIQEVSPARALAFEILTAVERGGYASDLLASRAAPLETRDAGLASEIVFGVLRYRAQLDYLIEHYSGKPADRLDDAVRQACAWASISFATWSAFPRTRRFPKASN